LIISRHRIHSPLTGIVGFEASGSWSISIALAAIVFANAFFAASSVLFANSSLNIDGYRHYQTVRSDCILWRLNSDWEIQAPSGCRGIEYRRHAWEGHWSSGCLA